MAALTDTFTLDNGNTIPKIGFGTWQIPDGAEAYDATAAALKAGYRHIDTARVYGNEASVGRAVRDSGIARDELFITTKLPAEVKDYDDAKASFDVTISSFQRGRGRVVGLGSIRDLPGAEADLRDGVAVVERERVGQCGHDGLLTLRDPELGTS